MRRLVDEGRTGDLTETGQGFEGKWCRYGVEDVMEVAVTRRVWR